MPLRLLDYIAKVYKKISDRALLYHSKLVEIPTPEFIVLYNGIESFPDEKILKLSDAFKSPPKKQFGSMELTVRVINININNKGNYPILSKCKELNGYSTIVGKVSNTCL
jgi:hypothetical protein